MLITVLPQNGKEQSYLYQANTGTAINLTALPGGSGMIAAALNAKDQAVGNGFFYSNGSVQSIVSLLPSNSGWSNLNATGINDAGQIIGQGLINGQEQAFLMTPIAEEVPEPAALLVWWVGGAMAGLCIASRGRQGATTASSWPLRARTGIATPAGSSWANDMHSHNPVIGNSLGHKSTPTDAQGYGPKNCEIAVTQRRPTSPV